MDILKNSPKKKTKTFRKKKNITSENKILSNTIEMEKLNFEIDKTTNNEILTNMTYLEPIDEKKLSALIKSKDILQITTEWWRDMNWFDEEEKSNERNFLIKMQNKMVVKNDKYYLKVHNFSQLKYGRIYPSKGLSQSIMRREIRHFLCKDLYWDIDLINAHPVILYNLCQHYDINCCQLEGYVKQRDEVISDYWDAYAISRDETKKLHIGIINGLKKSTIKKDYGDEVWEQIRSYYEECDNIRKELKKIDKQKGDDSLYTLLTKKKPIWARDGAFISHYLQIWEQQILQVMVYFAIEKNIIEENESNIVCCHDGMMLLKSAFTEDYPIETFIEELNEHIKEIIGMDIKAKSKAFDEAKEIEDALKEQKIDWTEEYIDEFYEKYGVRRADIIDDDDDTLTDLFYRQLKEKYRFCNGSLYRLDNYGLFKNCSINSLTQDFMKYMSLFLENEDLKDEKFEMKQSEELIKFINEIQEVGGDDDHEKLIKKARKKCKGYYNSMWKDMQKINKKTKSIKRSKMKNSNGLSNLIKMLQVKYTDDEFEEILDNDKNLLGFENGLFDCKTCEFRSAKEGEYVHMSCGYDYYVDERVEECKKEIEKIVRDMFEKEEDAHTIWLLFARCLRGEANIEEICVFLLGGGSNGKGLLMQILEMAFGAYYGVLNPNYFFKERADGTRDPELYGMRRKRFINVAEPDKNKSMITDTFKSSTGNDPLTVRTNNQKKNIVFILSCLFIHANHVIKFKTDTGGNSVHRRIKALNLPYTFVKEDIYNNMNEKERKSMNAKKQDNSLKKKFADDDYKRAIMSILMDKFKKYNENGIVYSENVQKDTEDYIRKIAMDKEWFEANLKKGDHHILKRELLDHFNTEMGKKWGGAKFKEKLEEFGFKQMNCKGYKLSAFDKDGNLKEAPTKHKGICVCNVKFTGEVEQPPSYF
jgi:phage/plasmid-associated DNA primase